MSPEHGREGGVDIRLSRPDDEPAIVELLVRAFGRWPTAETGMSAADFFRYKHFGCPFGESLRTLAVSDGRVVGFNSWLPWPLRFGDRVVPAMRGVDVAVDPEWRGQGIVQRMRRRAPEFIPPEVPFTWSNPNPMSHRGTLRSGQLEVGVVCRYVGHGVALGRRRPAAPAAELLAGLREDTDVPRGSGRRLETARTVAFLRWRYGALDGYRAVDLDTPRGRGLAIFTLRRRGRARVCSVQELLVDGDDLRLARALLGRVRRAAGADVLACTFPSRRRAAALGFVPARGGSPIVLRTLHETFEPDATPLERWSLSSGDLDVM